MKFICAWMERVKKNLEGSVRPGTSGKDFDLVVPIVKGCAVILRDPEESCGKLKKKQTFLDCDTNCLLFLLCFVTDSGSWNHQLDLEEPASTWAGWFCATQLGAERDQSKNL